MPKQKITVWVEPQSYAIVNEHLAKVGLNLSKFLTTILVEFAEEIQGQEKLWAKKPLEDLTLKEFAELSRYWLDKAKE